MSSDELLGYELNMPRLAAEQVLNETRYRADVKFTATQLYHLILAATEDRKQAEAAFKAKVESDLVNDRTPQ